MHNKDNSSKTMVIDERMTTRDVMMQLIEKNHYDYSANWALVEEMPSLFLGIVIDPAFHPSLLTDNARPVFCCD